MVSINTADLGSGAEAVAWRLRTAFENSGLESWLLVGDKKTQHSQVLTFWGSPFFDYRPFSDPKFQLEITRAKESDRRAGIDDFHFPYSDHVLELTGSRPDIVVCHNLHGGYFDLRSLARLSEQIPTVLLVHDLWPITGHCAQPMTCPKWQTGCGGCPDLVREPSIAADATHYNWLRKQRIYQRSNLWVACPTRWTADKILSSMLQPAIQGLRVIPDPIDTATFHPGPAEVERAQLKLPMNALIAVFIVNQGRNAAYKDYPTLLAAAQQLAFEDLDRPLIFVGLGEELATIELGGAEIRFVPFLPSEGVASYLRAADVFVHATKAETSGLSVEEAVACGTPVIASSVAGVPEVLGFGEWGRLVPPGDPDALANAIRDVLADSQLRARMGREGALHAKATLDSAAVARVYLEWFEEILDSFRSNRSRGPATT